jgi:opacity protein-like surface antigen
MSILKAVEFSVKEKSIIYTNAVKVLDNYQTIINQMGEYVVNDIEKAKSSAESLLELFVNRQVMIYNDLDPAHKLSEFYEAETYSSNIILWYPDGLTTQLDLGNAKVSDIMTHDENVYSIDILVKKTINGNYLNQTLNKNVEELTFRIAFGLENKSLTNFKIVGIRSASSNYVIDYSKALKEVNSEDFNAEDMAKIKSELKNLLKDYTNFLSLIGDPQEQADDKEFYKTSFLKLFTNADTRIYNDIEPEPPTSLISTADYLSGYIADYPNGIKNISINSDSAKFGKVMKANEGNYYTYVDADKFFSGSFKGKDAFRKMFPLIFKISFNASGKTFSGFTINSIDISSVNFYQVTPGNNAAEQKPEITIKPVTRKGLGMSLIGSFGQTQINSPDITSLSVAKDLHSWNVSPLYGYLTAFGVSYYFTDNIALRSGIEFNKYSEKYSLSGKFTNNTLTTDINATSYYSIIEANYDSLVTINYLTLPILASYTSGKPGKFGFYAEGGVKISIPASANYSVKGDYKTSGYYPSHPAVTQYLSSTELGFYTRQSIDETDKIKMKGFNLAFYSSVGINIPLGYYSSINIGPEMIIGLSDILSNKKKYIDIFGKSYPHQPTKIKNFGIRISLAYKL